MTLLETIAALRERIAQLESELGFDWVPPEGLDLRPMERKFLGLLVKRGHASHSQLHIVMWGEDETGGPECAERMMWMVACWLRKKIGWDSVITVRGYGYRLEKECRKRLQSGKAWR